MEYEEVKCGTFMDLTFGGLLRKYRLKREFGLREYGRLIGLDSANVSHLERSRHSPPDSRARIEKLVAPLNLDEKQVDFMCWQAFSFHLGKLQERFEKPKPGEPSS